MGMCLMCRLEASAPHRRCVSSSPMPINPIQTDDLDFELPKELIATKPVEPRDSSRLLVVQRSNPDRIEHRVFSDLPSLLSPEDLLVFNRSRVVPARLIGENAAGTGGRFEGLYLHELDPIENQPSWIVLLKAKRTKPGKRYRLFDANDQSTDIIIELIEKHTPEGPGAWKVVVLGSDQPTQTILKQVGHTPLPPYILAQRKARDEHPSDAYDRSHYQTVYASKSEIGSVAAPTAGLHFTPAVLDALTSRSVRTSEVMLHVGAGTFKPIETDTLDAHPMHAETCSMGNSGAFFPSKPEPESGRRTFAVGSTSARTLESFAALHQSNPDLPVSDLPESISTQILIQPGYTWRWVDGMITNFHLPRSTLLAMVASMLDIPGQVDGLERIQAIYAQAIHEQYRFFSYGDAMLILP